MDGLNKILLLVIITMFYSCKPESSQEKIPYEDSAYNLGSKLASEDSAVVAAIIKNAKVVGKVRKLAVNELEFECLDDFDFYLYYEDASPIMESKIFTFRMKDSMLYSYEKTLSVANSNNYELLSANSNSDLPITLIQTYRKHSLKLLDSLKERLELSNFYQLNNQNYDYHKPGRRVLYVHQKGKGTAGIIGWEPNDVFDTARKYIMELFLNELE